MTILNRILKLLDKHKALVVIFLAGLFLKLLIMPFAMHADLLSMYFRSYLMAEHGAWQLPGNQYLGHVVYAVNLLGMKLTGWDLTALFPLPFGLVPGSLTASVGNWLVFQEIPRVNEVLFWWKVPHLLADIVIFWLLARIFARSRRRNMVLALWWLNPVNLYAFYLFARHDVLTSLVLLLAVWLTAQRRLLPAVLALFAAIQVRVQPLLLVPLFAVAWWKGHSLGELLKSAVLSAGIIGLYLGVISLLPVSSPAVEEITGRVVVEGQVRAVSIPGGRFSAEVVHSFLGGLPLFLVGYGVLGLAFFLLGRPGKTRRLEYFNAWLLMVMALYFTVNTFSPHYFVWLSIFWTVGVGFQKKLLWPYVGSVVGWLIMGAMATDAFSINQNLFLPAAPGLFRTPQLPALLASRGIDPANLFLVGRGVLSAALAALAWQTFQLSIRPFLSRKIDWKKVLKPGVWLGLVAVFLIRASLTQAVTVPVAEYHFGSELIVLQPGVPLVQTFVSPVDQFGALEIQLASDRVPSDQALVLRLREVGETEWWYEGEVSRDDLYDYAYYPFGFPVVTGALDREFELELELRPAVEESWTAAVGGDGGVNVRVLADDTAVFQEQVAERWQAAYDMHPTFWWGYGSALAVVGVSAIGLVLLPRREAR